VQVCTSTHVIVCICYLQPVHDEGPIQQHIMRQEQRDIDNEGEEIVSVENIKHWGNTHLQIYMKKEGVCVCVCV
jgi:hypothetical protein